MKYCCKKFVAILAVLEMAAVSAELQASAAKPPFPYIWSKAYHILPETHNNESGYFSLCEGLDGKIYVGTAKYDLNSYLVEFDPRTEKQKVVLDVHKVAGVTATGYAAQAKLHTRNFVGPSGTIYVGSMQGYPRDGDTTKYPGGYVLTYDPQTGAARSLGMPRPGEGVIDVVADEKRGLLYVATCLVVKEQHWMLYDMKSRQYRDLNLIMAPFATTLIDAKGRANTLTRDFQLAQYDPATGKVTVRDIALDGVKWRPHDAGAVPTWNLAADGKTAYLMFMSDTTLYEIDLGSDGNAVPVKSCDKMLEGKNPDSRCALSIAPDGRVYAVIRVDNTTGFGTGYLHHLARFDPRTRKMEDLGVLAVRNPDFFDFRPRADGKLPPWSGGYHKLPDGTLTPLYSHMAMIVARDGTIYVTILYPFTLLKIDAFKLP